MNNSLSKDNSPQRNGVIEIIRAMTDIHMDEVRRLCREYVDFLGVDLCFQSFEEEMEELPGKYDSPGGCLLIAVNGDAVIGCVAVRPLEDDVCEMKRLYVRPEYRGCGAGRMLVRRIIDEAIAVGYLRMRLDTLDTLTEAMTLYESFGFKKTSPYYYNPLTGVVYWELLLRM